MPVRPLGVVVAEVVCESAVREGVRAVAVEVVDREGCWVWVGDHEVGRAEAERLGDQVSLRLEGRVEAPFPGPVVCVLQLKVGYALVVTTSASNAAVSSAVITLISPNSASHQAINDDGSGRV